VLLGARRPAARSRGARIGPARSIGDRNQEKPDIMRTLLILFWLCVPLLAGAYHYGPGQERLVLERVAQRIETAKSHVASESWGEAVAAYTAALDELPAGHVELQRSLLLERAKAHMFVSELPQAHRTLEGLLHDQLEDPNADPELLADTRAALANSQYYMTWLLRLEGQPREKWEPGIEAARQHYKLLAGASKAPGARRRYQEDLEATIRLARMDLSELQGLPLPSQ